jgi:rfaE bifunctional protein kinase chain/domain
MNDTSQKVVKLNDASIKTFADEIKRMVVCYGHFNVIHPGHMRYLKYARGLGDGLIVLLQADADLNDSGDGNYYPEDERAEGVSLLHIVDYVVILKKGDLDYFIKTVKPQILVLGSEHERENDRDQKINSAIELLKGQNGKVVFHAGETHYANTDLLHADIDDLELEKITLFKKVCRHQDIGLETLEGRLKKIENVNLLVVGDTIVDQYVACDAIGMSAEAPVLVVRELESREFIGGAAIVALHVKALGANCHFLSVVGDDLHANNVKNELSKQGVSTYLVSDVSRPTTYKIRYMVDNQKLFRVSKLKEHRLSTKVEELVIEKILQLAPEIDGILVSDFVYGVITNRVLDTIKNVAEKYNLKIFGDVQCSSQLGKVTKFKNFDLVCPTEREARLGLGNNVDGIEFIANSLIEELGSKELLITLGSEGFIAYSKQNDGFINRQHYPAMTANPVDVAGAGDSLFAAVSTCITSGANIMEASAIGACMASLAVREVGNQPITANKLKNYLARICA